MEAAVLSRVPPAKVELVIVGRPPYPMVAVADQRTGLVHSQRYSVHVTPVPDSDFEYSVVASFGGSVSGATAVVEELVRSPAFGNQSVVVMP
jgi:hypothetical protein